ncbi:MAG: tetratricopeptide repeat protein, partial [Bacteroidota bacterium]
YYTAMAHYQKGDFGTGLKFLELAVKRGGGSVADVYYNLGLGYYNTGSYKKAEDNLILALTLDQKNAMSYRLLAEVFNKQGKSAEAQECMNRYYALGGK